MTNTIHEMNQQNPILWLLTIVVGFILCGVFEYNCGAKVGAYLSWGAAVLLLTLCIAGLVFLKSFRWPCAAIVFILGIFGLWRLGRKDHK